MIHTKRAMSAMLLVLSFAQCAVGGKETFGNANVNSRRQVSGRTVALKGQGISFIIPLGWHKDEERVESDHSQFSWLGPGNTRFAINVSISKPEYGNRSIEDETNSFYQSHMQGGSKDVRLLEIDGVRGVHFRVDWDWFDQNYQPELHMLVKWNAQRMYGAKRQIISVDLSCPAKIFTKDQDILYGILESIKFTQNESETLMTGITPAETTDEPPVIVSVPFEDEFYLLKKRVGRGELPTAVDNLLWNLPEQKQILYVKASPNVAYGTIVSIIDDIRALGYSRIGLAAAKNPERTETISSGRETGARKKQGGKSSGEQATGAPENRIVVTVETLTEGRIAVWVGQTRVALRELASSVRTLLKDREDKSVKIVAPAATRYGSIVQVIDEVKAGGANSVELGTI